jgi:hypothetical protein
MEACPASSETQDSHPVAPATADVSALAPVIIASPSTAVIIACPATPQSIG